MRTRALMTAATAALLGAIVPVPSLAQLDYSADFVTARRHYVEGQPMKAAYTLGIASGYVRQQLGRARDGTVGERLI